MMQIGETTGSEFNAGRFSSPLSLALCRSMLSSLVMIGVGAC